MIRGAGAVLPEQTIATFDTPVQVWDWSRDGRSLLIGRKNADTGDDLWIQAPTEGAAAQPYAVAPFNQVFGVLSPDGKSIAYASDESGQSDIYVDTFPKPTHRARLTTSGGTEPRWSADGRELYFRRGSEIHALALDGFEVRSLTTLFDAGAAIRAYDVSRDGRFLLNMPADDHAPAAATMVHHWKPAAAAAQ
jgi:Tol biopolymer transport system component